MTITDTATAQTADEDADALLARATTGDREAFASFYDLTAPRIFAILLSMTQDGTRSEALLTEIYLEAWECLERHGSPSCAAWAWLAVLAHGHATRP